LSGQSQRVEKVFLVSAVLAPKRNIQIKKSMKLAFFVFSVLTHAGGVGNLRRFHSEALYLRAVSVEQKPAWMKSAGLFLT
jgi:hypothetical protein